MIEADDIMEPPAYLDSFKYDNLEDMEKLSVNALLSPSLSLLKPHHRYDPYYLLRNKTGKFRHHPEKNAADPRRHRTGSLGTGKETIRERR